ncbi:division abnormally delayed protein [Drosophila eugracilis]|uniref:division abnormally delayed protein n=1 Tax=Drosophila eugracilis TaxID=29029 RepID=UPI0007E79844|nr:division abnormally delayed protein [Drosophila eugracilis]
MAARSIRLAQLLLFTLLCGFVSLSAAKHLDMDGGVHHHQHHQHSATTHHRRRLQRDSRAKDAAGGPTHQCDAVKSYFESIDIKSSGIYSEKGAVCGGSCCNNATELELRDKAAGMFEQLLHHHTSSLRGVLETNAKQFQSHVLELAQISENNTHSLFSKVYARMVPQSRMMIQQLYTEIMNHLIYTSNYTNSNGQMGRRGMGSVQSNLEEAVRRFFVQLFPVAYHQVVHLSKSNLGDLHEDYVNCLQHNFDEMHPFGDIPRQMQTSLGKSVHMSNVFMNALLQAAEVLSEADALYGEQLTDTCKLQLLKMHYCPNCNGHHSSSRSETKLCYGYCKNVMRGCSAEYAGLLDSPWSSVVDALNNLVTTHILSENGIITVIKHLQNYCSDAIMAAMNNGPDLEMKVQKTCGTPSLTPYSSGEPDARPPPHKNNMKWATDPDPGMVLFLSTIDKSKEFYTTIVDNFCDEQHSREDHSCWTGDRIGDYTQLLISPGTDNQRYNPEVPFNSKTQASQLNELVDKLIKIRKSIGAAAPSSSIQASHDIQNDMGEGSGGGEGQIGDDEEEYGGAHGSGDGSGDGPHMPIEETEGTTTNEVESRDSGKSRGSNPLEVTTTWMLLTLVTMLFSSCS